MAASLELHIPLEAATNKDAVAAYKEREARRQWLKEEQVGRKAECSRPLFEPLSEGLPSSCAALCLA
jgi:hypothetical protein